MFFFNDTATTEIYTYGHTLSLHDALPISGVHQRERRTADRRHRRGTVRLGDLRDDADGVRELFHRRHHGEDAALGEATVADLATLRAHHAAGFTDRIGREDRKSTRLNSSH